MKVGTHGKRHGRQKAAAKFHTHCDQFQSMHRWGAHTSHAANDRRLGSASRRQRSKRTRHTMSHACVCHGRCHMSARNAGRGQPAARHNNPGTAAGEPMDPGAVRRAAMYCQARSGAPSLGATAHTAAHAPDSDSEPACHTQQAKARLRRLRGRSHAAGAAGKEAGHREQHQLVVVGGAQRAPHGEGEVVVCAVGGWGSWLEEVG